MIAGIPVKSREAAGTQASSVGLYRVVPRRDSKAPFDGRSNRSGGRWSSPGVPAVYASRSPAGAVLEFVAHLDGEKPVDLTLVSATLPAGCVLIAAALPGRWRDPPPYLQSVQAFGDRWIASRHSLALQVPSVLCDEVNNLLLNPEHPDASRIDITSIAPFMLDPRLLAR